MATFERTREPGIYRRGGSFYVEVTDALGRRRRPSCGPGVTSLAAAKRMREEWNVAVRRGDDPGAGQELFASYACRWIVTFKGRTRSGVRDESRNNYAKAVGVSTTGEPILRDGKPIGAIAHFGQMQIGKIRPRDVREYLDFLGSERRPDPGHPGRFRPLSANSVRLVAAALRVLFATAREDGDITSSPCTGLRLASTSALVPRREVRPLTDEEYSALLAATPEQHRLLVEFVCETGVRVSELIALRWGDVDLDEGSVSISRRIYRGTEAAPKSKYGVRLIWLPDYLVAELRLRRATPAAFVFPSETGGSLDPTNIRRWFKRAARDAGVPWAGLHTLRHTCVAGLLRDGWRTEHAQVMAGHHSPAFTASVYGHVRSADAPRPRGRRPA